MNQKPSPSLCFVNPVLGQTGGGEIAEAVANGVSGAEPDNELLVISAEFGKHVVGAHCVQVVLAESLMSRNLAYGECVGTDLPSSFRNRVCHIEDLVSLVIEQKMIVAEMAAVHVPVKILGFEEEGKYICQHDS